MLNFAKFSETFGNFLTKIEIAGVCKGVHCVDLGESFQTHIFFAKFGFDTAENEVSKVRRVADARRPRRLVCRDGAEDRPGELWAVRSRGKTIPILGSRSNYILADLAILLEPSFLVFAVVGERSGQSTEFR